MAALNPVQTNRRSKFVFALLTAFALAIAVRLFYWQVVQRDVVLAEKPRYRGETTLTLHARRGDIVTSDGVLLATDIYSFEVVAYPKWINDKEKTAAKLSPILNRPQPDLAKLLNQSAEFVMLDLNAPGSVESQLRELQDNGELDGVSFLPKPLRRYPNSTLAAHVVGFVNIDRQPAYGLEQYYNDILAGADGNTTGGGNALHDEVLWFDTSRDTPPVDGSTLVLTLNGAMQNIVERELGRALQDSGSSAGQILILDANTSAILALASRPAPDLNAYSTSNLNDYNDPAVSAVYEPGSVFKVITLAAGLDSGRINANTTFNDTGSVVVGGRAFYNHDFLKPGIVNLVEVMKQSLNVEACKISTTTGARTYYQYLHDFGLGSMLGVDLASELPGMVKNPGDGVWYESDLCSNAFGQGIALTPLQMANALAVVANGGRLMRPYLVSQVVHPDGTIDNRGPQAIRQVLKPETSKLVNDILAQAIGVESINKAIIKGYRIAGKTGTAQIPIPGGYDPKWTIASFGGYFPVDRPQYVILVKLDRPTSSPWGSVVASPVFARVAEQLAQLTGLPPDDVRLNK